jgi:hypothetical protein
MGLYFVGKKNLPYVIQSYQWSRAVFNGGLR